MMDSLAWSDRDPDLIEAKYRRPIVTRNTTTPISRPTTATPVVPPVTPPVEPPAVTPPPTSNASLAWSGFNTGRAQDITKSAKDAFLYYGQRATWMPRTKEEAETWFNEWILPGVKSQGFNVSQVVGDKAFVHTRENPGGEWVDFLINAGGANPELGWQSEMAGQNTAATAAAPTASTVGTPVGSATTGLPGSTGPSLLGSYGLGGTMSNLAYIYDPSIGQYVPRQQVKTVTP